MASLVDMVSTGHDAGKIFNPSKMTGIDYEDEMTDTTTAPIRAWHFAQSDRKLRFGDNRIIEVGSRFTCNGELKMCSNGLHASESIIDALSYAPGPILSRVVLTGERIIGDDKVVAREREHVAVIDATIVLHEFACECAERALSCVNNPDPRSVEAVRVKRRWLAGKAGDDELAAARGAARAAAWAAEQVVARDAAWSAARAAARAAAWSAARSAAQDAGWSAARAAAWSAARAAAWAAEQVVARDEERRWQESRLLELVAQAGIEL